MKDGHIVLDSTEFTVTNNMRNTIRDVKFKDLHSLSNFFHVNQ